MSFIQSDLKKCTIRELEQELADNKDGRDGKVHSRYGGSDQAPGGSDRGGGSSEAGEATR